MRFHGAAPPHPHVRCPAPRRAARRHAHGARRRTSPRARAHGCRGDRAGRGHRVSRGGAPRDGPFASARRRFAQHLARSDGGRAGSRQVRTHRQGGCRRARARPRHHGFRRPLRLPQGRGGRRQAARGERHRAARCHRQGSHRRARQGAQAARPRRGVGVHGVRCHRPEQGPHAGREGCRTGSPDGHLSAGVARGHQRGHRAGAGHGARRGRPVRPAGGRAEGTPASA